MITTALNIRSGGGSRVDRLLRYLEACDADTFVLTEWRAGLRGNRFSTWAEQQGMHHAHLTDGGTANGVFVASKRPFQAVSRRPIEAGAGVLLQAHFQKEVLLACYFPQRHAKSSFFAQCVTIAREHSTAPFLLMGDLNTGNQITDKESRGAAYHCAIDFDSLSSGHGLCDLWRRSHSDEAREWTWQSNTGNGFRIDHAFANETFIRRANPYCHYDHSTRENRLTDHSALTVEYTM